MYETLKNELTRRMLELTFWIESLDDKTNHVKIYKGLFFVYLYGIWESIVQQVVIQTIDALNSSNDLIKECNYDLYSLIFSGEYDAIYSAGSKTKWEKRWAISDRLNNNEAIHISTPLMPTDGRNIRYRQLKSIAKSFGIQDPIVPRTELEGRLQEVVDNRNWIAHGDKSPSEVGARYTVNDLKKRREQIEELAMYVISTYEHYIAEKKYLKV